MPGNYYYSGQGSLMMATRNPTTGKPEGFRKIGNVPELTLDIEVDKFEHKESETGSRSLDLTFAKERRGKFKFKLENLILDNLAVGLYGESASVAGGSVPVGTPESVIAYSGMYVTLAHPNVSAVVVKDSTDTTTYTADVDYRVSNAKAGTLEILTGGAIVDEAVLHFSYTYGAYTNMEAFTQSSAPERWLRFEGLNTVDDSVVVLDLYRAQFDPLTGYGLITEELASVDMSGSLLKDEFITTSGDSQFFRQRNIA